MKKKVNEVSLSMSSKQLEKERGHLKPTDSVTIVDEPKTPITSVTPVTEDDTIEPQDKTTIKYLSNVKDHKTGEISKPFTIGDKRYQMVRGTTPKKEVVMGVYCLDDMNEAGENIIHPVDYFDENIAKKAMNEGGFDYAAAERDYHDKESLKDLPKKDKTSNNIPEKHRKAIEKQNAKMPNAMKNIMNPNKSNESLKLSEFKHFLVNKKNGKVRKFKRDEELAKGNMTEDESYMNLNNFKKHVDEALFGNKRGRVSEVDVPQEQQLKPDVQKAIEQMVLKIKPYMDKINDPIEKVQLIVKLTTMLQLDPSKYPLVTAGLKKASGLTFGTKQPQQPQNQTPVTENKIITKNQLMSGLSNKVVKRTIKIKDIK